MIQDPNRIYDGFASLEAGVDAGREAHLLDPNQCVSTENMIFRGGKPVVRPGFRQLSETFTNGDHCYVPNGRDAGEAIIPHQSAQEKYKVGRFQCAQVFNPHNGPDSIMALIDGRLFKIVPGVTEAEVTEIVLPFRNASNLPIAYMVQADKWFVAQDGQSKPILFDGSKARRADSGNTDREKTEVPIGTIMTYGMGRIVVVVNGQDVAFGDLLGSHEGPDPADSLILFTERNFLSEGFDAAIPSHQGKATGAIFFPQLDTSTGNGQLLVFAEKGASSFFLSLPREEWKTSSFQILSLLTTGLRGHRSIAAANEDLWFRSYDGWRTWRQARSEQQGWAHIPLSTNVKQWMDSDTPEMLEYASSIYFDNRVIGTTTPHWNQGRVYHDGLVVVDFDILSSFGQKYRPAWDGHWKSVRVSQVFAGEFNGVRRAFFFGLDAQDNNQLYEFSQNDKNDFNGKIEWELITRSMDFKGQKSEFEECELYGGDIWVREVAD